MLGLGVGSMAGFFGIGGGTVLIPGLLLMGYEMKPSIGISVFQMAFASLYGSYLNFKQGSLAISTLLPIAFGGFTGALLSGTVVTLVPAMYLEYSFLGFVSIALMRMLYTPKSTPKSTEANVFILFLIGTFLGVLSISIGVGGSLLLVPILVGFFNYELKKAISAGLFFVVFSSVSGLISLSMAGHVIHLDAFIIASASLVGVFMGIKLSNKTSAGLQKKLLLVFYISVLSYLLFRTFS